jgi:hypothetical protein
MWAEWRITGLPRLVFATGIRRAGLATWTECQPISAVGRNVTFDCSVGMMGGRSGKVDVIHTLSVSVSGKVGRGAKLR